MSTDTLKPPIAANLRRLKDEASVTWRDIGLALDVPERNVYEWAKDPDRAKYVASWGTCVALAEFFSKKLGRRVQPGHFYLEAGE